MASAIFFDEHARRDFDRNADHLQRHEVENIAARIDAIVAALDVLRHSPLIGRPVGGNLRELVIGRSSRGYVVLYRHVADLDMVFVMALRAQREAGYPGLD